MILRRMKEWKKTKLQAMSNLVKETIIQKEWEELQETLDSEKIQDKFNVTGKLPGQRPRRHSFT